jgi:endo-alpha-1,4-polygalactosaminidase (GH114 family)
MSEDRKKRINASRLKVNEYLCDIQYYKIIQINPQKITVVNERGFEFDIDRDIVEEGLYSASQYQIEKAITRTEICEILERAGSHVFTVNFNRQVQEQELQEKLLETIKQEAEKLANDRDIEKAIKKLSKEALKGKERTLVGYLLQTEQKMGRSLVIDLQVAAERNRIRLVDHRTLNWLILQNVKYTVKQTN